MATEIICRTRNDWLDHRRRGITASEIATILGLSPWLSPFSLYWHKVSGYEEPDNARKARGRRLEMLVGDDFADAHSDLITVGRREVSEHPYAIMYAHSERPWQLATPDELAWPATATVDFEAVHNSRVVMPVELKTSASREGWGKQGTDEVPAYYRAQLLWQMDVLNAERGYLAVWIGLDDYRDYEIERDEFDLIVMREAAESFLARIEAGEQPPIDYMDSTATTIRRLHPQVSGDAVVVDDDILDEWDSLRREIKALQAKQQFAENLLRDAMGDASVALDSQGRTGATRSIYTRRAYSVKETVIDRLTPGRRDGAE